jgi:hypothetical protein
MYLTSEAAELPPNGSANKVAGNASETSRLRVRSRWVALHQLSLDYLLLL